MINPSVINLANFTCHFVPYLHPSYQAFIPNEDDIFVLLNIK